MNIYHKEVIENINNYPVSRLARLIDLALIDYKAGYNSNLENKEVKDYYEYRIKQVVKLYRRYVNKKVGGF